jgi:hypothetical protein
MCSALLLEQITLDSLSSRPSQFLQKAVTVAPPAARTYSAQAQSYYSPAKPSTSPHSPFPDSHYFPSSPSHSQAHHP